MNADNTNVEYDENLNKWLFVIEHKQVHEFSDEELACEAQRMWRFAHGFDEITGEKLT